MPSSVDRLTVWIASQGRPDHRQDRRPLPRGGATPAAGPATELRASTSLARLWRDHGKRTEARDILAPIYNWFTEGFDTPVLQDAKALLDQLA